MRKFLKENLLAVVGVALPLLMVLAFAAASAIPKYLVAAPKHDLLFLTNYYFSNEAGGLEFQVVEKKLKVTYLFVPKTNLGYSPYTNQTKLFRFEAATGKTREIEIQRPIIESSERTIKEIDIPELKGIEIDTSNTGPDGYEYINNYDRDYPGVMGALFYGSYDKGPIIAKEGRTVAIKYGNEGYTYYAAIKFLGWIVK